MQKLLFLSQRIPFPPDKGEKIRAYHFLRHLAQSHEIYLGCLIDDEADNAYVGDLEALCAEIHAVPISKLSSYMRGVAGLVRGRPLTCSFYNSRELRIWAEGILAAHRLDAVFIFSASMAQYAVNTRHRLPLTIMDFVDVDSDKWRIYAEKSGFPMSLLYRREARTLLAHDRRVAARCDASIFVSKNEAELFGRLAPDLVDRIDVVPNGVDLERFSPGAFASPFVDLPGPVYVFTGTMDYFPNVDAVQWFAREVMPNLRETDPDARFFIVGAKPKKEVAELGELPGVDVTGRVEDVRPYIAHADAIVAPMRIARGVQNKVIEGMAMAKPVVTTPQGLEGLDAIPDRDLLVAPAETSVFADACRRAVQPELSGRLAPAARQYVESNLTWSASFDRLDGILNRRVKT